MGAAGCLPGGIQALYRSKIKEQKMMSCGGWFLPQDIDRIINGVKNMDLLELKGIDISFSGIQILFNVDFHLQSTEIHCICGENGAGKSTLVKILTGIYSHYTGEIKVCSKPVVIQNPRIARQLGIYAVQQHRDLVPTLNAVENIFMGNEIFKKGRGKQLLDFAKMRERSEQLVSKFGISIDLDVAVGSLKVSEQCIIAICKALAAESRILIIDEASAPLDNAERQILYTTLRMLRDEGKGIIYITHHLEEVFNIGDRITVLRNGENVITARTSELNKESLIHAMTGDAKIYDRRFTSMSNKNSETPVITFDSVSSKFLKEINFRVFKGEIVGFAGLEGSHKHEIARTALGLEKYSKGSIVYNGKAINIRHPIDAIRAGIGLVPTDRKNAGLITCRSVAENIILSSMNRFKMNILNSKWIREAVTKNIRSLGIKTSGMGQLVEYLSGGNQQKVLISKWLEAKVDLLFLIEPTEGIDVGARSDLYKIFRELSSRGKTLIIFTSDIDELMVLSDRIYAMVNGRIIREFDDVNKADKQTILTAILTKYKSEEAG